MRQTQGIYLISVVAKTLEMHPQTLRKYERAGFIEPLRMGSLRTYSDEDVARLRLIKHFVDDMGLNLAGVEVGVTVDQRTSGGADATLLRPKALRAGSSINQPDRWNAGDAGGARSPEAQSGGRCFSTARRGLVQSQPWRGGGVLFGGAAAPGLNPGGPDGG